LEEFITRERARNGIPDWQAPAQYLAVISLKSLLKKYGDKAEIVIYDPGYPDDKDRRRIFDIEELRQIHDRLETQLAGMGWATVRPSEKAFKRTKEVPAG
jgi:hypothetical protein